MDKKNLMPQPAQPIHRITTGQLPSELAELSEEALQLQGDDAFGASVLPQWQTQTVGDYCLRVCSYDGDDVE